MMSNKSLKANPVVTLIRSVYHLLISMGAEIARFAESFQSFHYGSQKVKTYFAGLAKIGTSPCAVNLHWFTCHMVSVQKDLQMLIFKNNFPHKCNLFYQVLLLTIVDF
jgi:predicted N-formylglutamate amidohydrolase